MKIGACSVSFRNEPLDIFQICDVTAGIGIKHIEIWANHLALSKNFEKFLKKLSKKLKSTDLSVSMIAPYFDLTADKNSFHASIENCKKMIYAANILESPILRVFTGTTGSIQTTKRKYNQCIEGLLIMSDEAAKSEKMLALETHPNTLADNLHSCLKLMESIKRENVGINLDIYHLWEEHKTTWQIFDTLREKVLHIHAKNAISSKVKNTYQFLHQQQAGQKFSGIANLRDGDMPYDSFLSHIIKNSFNGTFSIEWFGNDPLKNILEDLKFVQDFLVEAASSTARTCKLK